jgi:dihydrofolate reductase
MRKLTFGAAISLDHYLARNDGSVDWILWSDEAAATMSSFWSTIDTVLWGRKTYDFAVRNGQKQGYIGKENFVFSRTLDKSTTSVPVVSEDIAQFVADLKANSGNGIALMGGGDVARTLFEAGLIDEIHFTVHPLLLGAGVPLFHPMTRQINLELLECRAYQNGCVSLSYRIPPA